MQQPLRDLFSFLLDDWPPAEFTNLRRRPAEAAALGEADGVDARPLGLDWLLEAESAVLAGLSGKTMVPGAFPGGK